MEKRTRPLRSHPGHNRLKGIGAYFALLPLIVLAACGVTEPAAGDKQSLATPLVSAISTTPAPTPPASTTPAPTLNPIDPAALRANMELENYSERIRSTIAQAFPPEISGGLYVEDKHIMVQVTDLDQEVTARLLADGIPPEVFTVQTVSTSRARLEQAQEAAGRWMGVYPGGITVGIDTTNNSIGINVEPQPISEMIGYDPGDDPTPYADWPSSLKQELDAFPDVTFTLKATFGGIMQLPDPSDENSFRVP